jgi:hypothetical protein
VVVLLGITYNFKIGITEKWLSRSCVNNVLVPRRVSDEGKAKSRFHFGIMW